MSSRRWWADRKSEAEGEGRIFTVCDDGSYIVMSRAWNAQVMLRCLCGSGAAINLTTRTRNILCNHFRNPGGFNKVLSMGIRAMNNDMARRKGIFAN